jgi:hypothetical protein
MTKSRKPPQPPKQQRMRGAARFKRSETKRLLQSAVEVGLKVVGVEIDPGGTVRILVGKSDTDAPDSTDRELADFETRHGKT